MSKPSKTAENNLESFIYDEKLTPAPKKPKTTRRAKQSPSPMTPASGNNASVGNQSAITKFFTKSVMSSENPSFQRSIDIETLEESLENITANGGSKIPLSNQKKSTTAITKSSSVAAAASSATSGGNKGSFQFGLGVESLWKKKSRKKRKISVIEQEIQSLLSDAHNAYLDGNFENAIEILYSVIAKKPRRPQPYELLAIIHENTGNKLLSLKYNILSARFRHLNYNLWHQIANNAYILGQYDHAYNAINRLIRAKQYECEMITLRALCHLKLYKIRFAKVIMNEIRQKFPTYLTASIDFAIAAEEINRIDIALVEYYRYLISCIGNQYFLENQHYKEILTIYFPTIKIEKYVNNLPYEELNVEQFNYALERFSDLCLNFYDILARKNELFHGTHDICRQYDELVMTYNHIALMMMDGCFHYLDQLKANIFRQSDLDQLEVTFNIKLLYSIALMRQGQEDGLALGIKIINPLLTMLSTNRSQLQKSTTDGLLSQQQQQDTSVAGGEEGGKMRMDDSDEEDDREEEEEDDRREEEDPFLDSNDETPNSQNYVENIPLLQQQIRIITIFYDHGMTTRANRLLLELIDEIHQLLRDYRSQDDELFMMQTQQQPPQQLTEARYSQLLYCLSQCFHHCLVFHQLDKAKEVFYDVMAIDHQFPHDTNLITSYYLSSCYFALLDSRSSPQLAGGRNEMIVLHLMHRFERYFTDKMNTYNVLATRKEEGEEEEEGDGEEDDREGAGEGGDEFSQLLSEIEGFTKPQQHHQHQPLSLEEEEYLPGDSSESDDEEELEGIGGSAAIALPSSSQEPSGANQKSKTIGVRYFKLFQVEFIDPKTHFNDSYLNLATVMTEIRSFVMWSQLIRSSSSSPGSSSPGSTPSSSSPSPEHHLIYCRIMLPIFVYCLNRLWCDQDHNRPTDEQLLHKTRSRLYRNPLLAYESILSPRKCHSCLYYQSELSHIVLSLATSWNSLSIENNLCHQYITTLCCYGNLLDHLFPIFEHCNTTTAATAGEDSSSTATATAAVSAPCDGITRKSVQYNELLESLEIIQRNDIKQSIQCQMELFLSKGLLLRSGRELYSSSVHPTQPVRPLPATITPNYSHLPRLTPNMLLSSTIAGMHSLIPLSEEDMFHLFCKNISPAMEAAGLRLLQSMNDATAINQFLGTLQGYLNQRNPNHPSVTVESLLPLSKMSFLKNVALERDSAAVVASSAAAAAVATPWSKIFYELLLGHEAALKRQFARSIQHYYESFLLDPQHALTALSLSSLLIFLSFHRLIKSRKLTSCKGLLFLVQYKINRLRAISHLNPQDAQQGRAIFAIQQEIYYNYAKAFEILEIRSLAVDYYQYALELQDYHEIQRNLSLSSEQQSIATVGNKEYLPLTRQAAFNYVLLLKQLNALDEAYDVMSRYLTV